MSHKKVSHSNKNPLLFIGREHELDTLTTLDQTPGAKIVVLYGRRRVGKTTLIKQAFNKRRLLTFEGLQGRNQQEQLNHFAEQLMILFNQKKSLRIALTSWREAFLALWAFIEKGEYTIHLEELQWMANYQNELVSDLKYIWDNFWSNNPQLIVVLCGSAPSFLIQAVMRSKALHNRSQIEVPLGELEIHEAELLFPKNRSRSEKLDAYLAVGGIPEYLRMLMTDSSVYLSLVKNAFVKGGYFLHEAERIFTSGLSDSPEYRRLLELLARYGNQSQTDLLQRLRYPSGGGAKRLFDDLEMCEFTYAYTPLAFGEHGRSMRWMIRDAYLQMYFRLIKPKAAAVMRGDFGGAPSKGLPHTEYRKWLGLAFERFCLFNHRRIAKHLGFSAIEYNVGPYYRRDHSGNAQIDLVFDRKDRVLTVCEMKHLVEPPGKEIIRPFEQSLRLLDGFKKYSIHKVLVSPNGAAASLAREGYFDDVVEINAMFG
jgi:hypothetical protein